MSDCLLAEGGTKIAADLAGLTCISEVPDVLINSWHMRDPGEKKA